MDARKIRDSEELTAARKRRDAMAHNLAETAPLLSPFELRVIKAIVAFVIAVEFVAATAVVVARWREDRL